MMDLQYIPEAHREEILKMNWIRDVAEREYNLIGPLAEWLQDGDRCYEDIPPGLRSEIFYKDLRSGETHACSVWQALGYGVEEMRNDSWQDLIHPDDREEVRSVFHSNSYNRDIRIGQSLFRVIDADGAYRWILSASAAICRSEDGELFRYVGRDVEVGNRIEKELFLKRRIHEIENRSSRERALMEAAGRIAGSTEDSGLLTAVNDAAGSLFGLHDVRIIIYNGGNYRVGLGPALAEDFDWDILENVDAIQGTEIPGNLYSWHLGDVAEGHILVIFANGVEPGADADRLMGILGPIILGAWERVRHLDTLRRHATTDPLTGAWNRRAFMQQAGRSLRRSCEDDRPTTVAIMDIDHFKKVNDSLGHPFGDRVLVETADGMNGSLRSGDFMCRWGGEEFAFFLENTGRETAMNVVERIRIAAGESCGDTGHPITLSAGIYTIDPANHKSLEAALNNADEALLEAKAAGRNRSLEYTAE